MAFFILKRQLKKKGATVIIAILDAELTDKKIRKFPNLACMKLSAYYKNLGKNVILKNDFENLQKYEKVFISKVFTKTQVPDEVLVLPNVGYGGTGFFYEDAKPLPYEIEHIKPDYGLYDEYVEKQKEKGVKPSLLQYYSDYSIGFLTRGCFRKCDFCVNKKYDHCIKNSVIDEFYEKSKKKIMLLDDNILAYPKWREEIEKLCETKKSFTFKQGVDIRLINHEFAKLIDTCKYDGEIFFAFDNIEDRKRIEQKLELFRSVSNKKVCIYVFCGFDRNGKYDNEFWLNDIKSIFERLEIIGKYQAIPYLMRYEKYSESQYHGVYKTLATYCNKRGLFKMGSFSQFCETQKPNSCYKYYKEFIDLYPIFEDRYFSKFFWVKNGDVEKNSLI